VSHQVTPAISRRDILSLTAKPLLIPAVNRLYHIYSSSSIFFSLPIKKAAPEGTTFPQKYDCLRSRSIQPPVFVVKQILFASGCGFPRADGFRFLIHHMLFVVLLNEVDVHLLTLLSGFDGFTLVVVAAQVVVLPLETDFRHPFAPLPVEVDAGVAAGVVYTGPGQSRFQPCHRSTVRQLQLAADCTDLQTPAASGLPFCETGLSHHCILSAVAEASPLMYPSDLAGVAMNSQTAEALSDSVLQRRSGFASAAHTVSCGQLVKGSVHFSAAVAAAMPYDGAHLFDNPHGPLRCQKPKTSSAHILLSGAHTALASAVPDGLTLKTPRIQEDLASAVAATSPDNISPSAFARRFGYGKPADTCPDSYLVHRHSSTLFRH